MSILITGGAGYIGSHTVLELLTAGGEVVVVDNLSNSSSESLRRVQKLTGRQLRFYNADVCDKAALDAIFRDNPALDSVIHFAGFKAVGESVSKPLLYYQNNVGSAVALLSAMRDAGVKNIVFSSSATVYGMPKACPLSESASSTVALNPYGNTKKIIEEMICDECAADKTLNAALLRYFNPVGAHESGLIGEDPKGIPNNLMPYITQVAVGRLPKLNIFGSDYPTRDGTCVRDYIHVVDLAKGHLAALKKLWTAHGVAVYNLGTGKGCTVLETVNAFIKATDVDIPYEFAPRRAGDAPECYADTSKAEAELNWRAEKSLEDMCRDHYRWQKNNPGGYGVVP
ncbi:MAG: UDP-glucose 4-epimerase GalE [Firmicutes bacterium]|nr:UDP-glucose 4-epimerase GalE [Bacillota bacterium]